MKIYKRLISFFLVLAMMLGMVILPSPAFANKIEDRNEEVPYKIEAIDGQSYKFYKYTDVIGKQEPSIGLFAVANPIPDFKKYPIEVVWSTYDLQVADIGFPIVFEIVDIESGLTIAKTDENGITGSGQYYFNKTADWDNTNASHDPINWSLGVPEALNFDVRIKAVDGGEFAYGTIKATVTQKVVPLYKAEYFTNALNEPTIGVKRRDNGNSLYELKINPKNLNNGEYYSFSKFKQDENYYQGKSIDIKNYGPDGDNELKISDQLGAERWGMFVTNPTTNQPQKQGEFTDTNNNTKYVYNVYGDYRTPYTISVRQRFDVTFNLNGGSWKVAKQGEEKKDLVIPAAHSMKIGEAFGPFPETKIPTDANINAPDAADGTKTTFLGWNRDKKAKVAEDIATIDVKDDITLYAIYSEQGKGYVNIKYLDLENNDISANKLAEADLPALPNPLPEGTPANITKQEYYYPTKAEGDVNTFVKASDFTTANAPKFTGYEISRVDIDNQATYTKAKTYNVIYRYKKPSQKIGKVNIKYVDEKGIEIDAKYRITGGQYPTEKEGVLGSAVPDPRLNQQTQDAAKAAAPKFKGYVISSVTLANKPANYADPATATIKYEYYKKVTTYVPKNTNVYFPVIFDANKGEFQAAPKDKKTVYVYFDPSTKKTVEKVTYKEVKDEFDKAYKNPTKDGFDFIEWQDKADKGSAVADDYEVQFKGWNWQADPTNGYVPETFYAHYGKASAYVKYLDLNGNEIADTFKIDGAEYPAEKEGNLNEAIGSDVYTANNAPKFIGYKFNRVVLNPANAKYAAENKGTIKIYYEKLADVILDKTPDNDDDKPTGYVTVKFLADDAIHTGNDARGTLSGDTKFYVNPKAGKKNSDLTEPTIKAKTGFTVANPKWSPDFAADTAITADATYTAQYTDGEDVIPVPDPSNPPDKPAGYVTVTFDLDGKGTTTDTRVFFVKPNEDVTLTAPTVTGINNYKQKTGDDAWNPKFVAKAKYDKDKTFVAQYTFEKDVVPQGPGEDKPVVPDNYKKVTFKEGDHGIISASKTTIFWVNPDKEVTLTAPTVTANADYKHTAWKYNLNSQDKTTSGADATKNVKDTFVADTDITAQYKKKVVDTDPSDPDYVKVDFKAETHGKIKDGEKKEYWVLKDETVEIKTPAVEANKNYAFEKWDPAVQTSYSEDKTHNAVFKYTGDNVVPQKPDEEKPDVPDNFVEVEFNQGTNGTIANTETVTYWVNPAKEVTVTAPKVTATDGYKHVAWTYNLKATDTSDKEVKTLESITDTFTEKKTTITAKYLKKVVETDPNDKENYVKVTFKAVTNGKLADNKTEKSYWVLKDTPVSLTEPTVTANAGWKFIKFEPAVQASYSEDKEHIAQYKKIIVTEDPKDKDYVKVTFDPGKQGTIKAGSNAEVWVLKDETIDSNAITPELEINEKYALEKWDPAVKTSYSTDTKHTAIYKYNGDDVVPQKPGEDKPNVPDNFVKVTFVAGDHGSIANTETYIYWVNPEKQVTLNAPTVTANDDYKHVAWTYKLKATDTDVKTTSGNNALTTVIDTFTEKETTITAKYLKKVVTEDPNDTENYAKVTFVAGDHGTIATTETSTVWVLKNTDVKVDAPTVTPNKGYTFTEWSPAVKTNYDTDTTHTAQYKEKDKAVTEDPNDKDYIKVIFNANGGKIGTEATKDVWVLKDIAKFSDAKAKVATPTKDKATFKEWQDKDNQGTKVEDNKALSTENEIFYAAYTDDAKIIEDPTTPQPKTGYVRLTFDATADGKIGKNQEKYIDVLEGTKYEDTDLQNAVKKIVPTYKDNTKVFEKWNPEFPNTTDNVATSKYEATYKDNDKIIDKDPTTPGEIDDKYIRFVFDANTKDNSTTGKIGTAQKVIFDVLKGTRFSDADLQKKIEGIKAVADDAKLKFNVWEPSVLKDNTLVENATAENGMSADGKTITYNASYVDKDKIIDVTPGSEDQDPKEGYVRFIFNAVGKDADDAVVNGTVKGNAKYAFDVLKGTKFNDNDLQTKINSLKAVAKDYKFIKWTPDVLNDETLVEANGLTKHEYTATYEKLPKIIEDPTTPTPEEGYVRLTFDATAEGKIGTVNGKQTKIIDVLEGTPYTDNDLKDKINAIKAIPVKVDPNDANKKVEDTDKEFDSWNPLVPTTGIVDTATFTAKYKKAVPGQESIDITATKTWKDDKDGTPSFTTPEIKFELWRKAGQEEAVMVKAATALKNNSVTFSGVDKYGANSVEYTYLVKEVFTNAAEKDNWILDGNGVVAITDKKGTVNLTNKLKGDPQNPNQPNPDTDKVATLTITKKLENEPVVAQTTSSLFRMMRTPVANEAVKFKFTVTGPYDYKKEGIELAANETITLKNLAYGKYTVVETDTQGYTPEKASYEIILSTEAKDGAVTVVNKNIKSTDPQNPNIPSGQVINITVKKVWVGGEKPATTIELCRKGTGLNGKEFEEKVDSFTTTANGADTEEKVFKDLAKHDPSGKEFKYYAKETTIPEGYTAEVGAIENNVITVKNSCNIIPGDKNKPDGYVTVTFKAGEHGKINNGTKDIAYHVNPKADPVKTMADITKPAITADKGYKVADPKWKDANGVALNDATEIKNDLTYTAQYEEKDKAVTEDPNDPDYIKVTFNANGGHFETDTVTTKDVWVLKDIAKFSDAKAKVANPTKDKATFKEWQDKASQGTKVDDGKVLSTENEIFYAAWTDKDKIIEDPTTPTPEDGYVRLTFDATADGRIEKVDGKQTKIIDVLKDTPYTDQDLKDKINAIKAIPVKDDNGNTVADTEMTFDKWTPAVPTTGIVDTATFTASYKKVVPGQEEIEITATKIWQDADGQTPSFTTPEIKFELWRKAGQAGTEEIVKAATALTGNSVKFSGVDKYDANSVEYTYFVKEVFTNAVEKDNWILEGNGVVVMAANNTGSVTLTNKLKGNPTNPNQPDPDKDKVAKLTITKVLANEPVAQTIGIRRAPAQIPAQTKFSFKVTGPYGYEQEFELAANESKTLENLAYGDYKVEETDAKGYTAEYSKAKETLTKENLNGTIIVTNKNVKPDPSQPGTTNDNIISVTVKKAWNNVPQGLTTPQVKIELWRKGYDLNNKEFEQKVDEFTTAANNTASEETKVFADLAKQDPSGRDFSYYAKETTVLADYTSQVGTIDNNVITVTNTYKTVAPEPTDGKLTITKKLVNTPARMMQMRTPIANSEPIKFKFTVTKPDGTSEEFELAANESKTLENLVYGEYTIKETDTKGYTPFFAKGNEEAKQAQEFNVTINSNEGVNVTVTNKNIINQNDLTVRATKIWVGGPETDHTAVALTLNRTSAKAGSTEETVTDAYKTETINGNNSDTITYVWSNLPKHDGEGYPYTYKVEELGTVSDLTSTDKIYTVGSNDYVSKVEADAANTADETLAFKITNTYKVPLTDDEIKATKQWVGVPDGTATPKVKFQLQRTANGVTEDVGQAMALTNNQANFGKQDKTDANGNEYVYSVKELDANGNAFNHANYTSTVNRLTVTNTYKTEPAPEVKYTVKYVKGADAAQGTMTADTDVSGTYTVKANGFTNEGYTFKGWKVGDTTTIVQPGATINVTADVTLTAQWEKTTTPPTPGTDPTDFTINYYPADSSMGYVSPSSETVEITRGTIAGSTATAYSGYRFVRWIRNGVQVSTDANFVPTLRESATYIAVFEKIGSPDPYWPPTPGPDPRPNPDPWPPYRPHRPDPRPDDRYDRRDRDDRDDHSERKPEDTRPVLDHEAYMFGYSNGTVRPNGNITRAEAAALVTRLLGIEAYASAAKPNFPDTPSAWYNKAINAAVERGIMKGYPDGRFRPNAPITRAEFTQMISTIDNKPYGKAPFADVVGHWAERAIGSEYQAGRITGYPDGLFRPNAYITRCEAVVILNKIFERNYDEMSAINAMNKERIKVFTDLAPSFWGYNDMVEATNSHSFKRRAKGLILEDWVLVK